MISPLQPAEPRENELSDVHFPEADRIRVVLDNLSTHSLGALYQVADALKARCVLAEVRWRWTLKLLWAAACTERNLCADPTLLNPCILRSRRQGG